jgi:hypothetical protein
MNYYILNIVVTFLIFKYIDSLCSSNKIKKYNLFEHLRYNEFADSNDLCVDENEDENSQKGHDGRYNKIENRTEELFNITRFLELKKILTKLESKKIGTIEKLDIIEYYDILENNYKNNLYVGGLLDDWNFNI